MFQEIYLPPSGNVNCHVTQTYQKYPDLNKKLKKTSGPGSGGVV